MPSTRTCRRNGRNKLSINNSKTKRAVSCETASFFTYYYAGKNYCLVFTGVASRLRLGVSGICLTGVLPVPAVAAVASALRWRAAARLASSIRFWLASELAWMMALARGDSVLVLVGVTWAVCAWAALAITSVKTASEMYFMIIVFEVYFTLTSTLISAFPVPL